MRQMRLSEMTIEITQECLNRCLFCSSMVGGSDPHPALQLSLIEEALIQGVKLELQELSISGGEPFLHPHISNVLELCRKVDIPRVKVYTSGIIRNRSGEAAPIEDCALVEQVRRAHATVVFNVQSSKSAVHDQLVGWAGRLALSLRSMRLLVDAGIPVECHVVPNRLNVDSLLRTAHDLVEFGVHRVSFLRIVRQGNGVLNWPLLELDMTGLAAMREQLLALSKEPDANDLYRFGLPFSDVIRNCQTCQAGESRLLVRWDGKCFPCEAFKGCDPEFVIGTIGCDNIESVLERANSNTELGFLKRGITEMEPCAAQLFYSGEVVHLGRDRTIR